VTQRVVVAIDGPGGAGKSTLARRLAARLGFLYIDTGAMYRAVALWAKRRGVAWENAATLTQLAQAAEIDLQSDRVLLNGNDVTEAIRAPEISQGASRVSALAGVRRALVEKQRAMAERGSVVMEGRDIGTVVFPDARVKIFLDAPAPVRAARRLKDLAAKEAAPTHQEVLAELNERDTRDRARAEAPLMQAPDAVYVDSGPHTLEQVEEILLKIIREKTANGKDYQR